MTVQRLRRGLRVLTLGAVFGAGCLFATVTQTTAQAQMGDPGQKVMEAADSQGDSLGSVTERGMSITDMRKNATALNENLDKFDKIESARGGG
jgi:hypothetical protein